MRNKMTGTRVLAATLLASVAAGARAEGPAFSGFVDFGYNYNFNKMTTNNLRGFDDKANTFTLQNAKLSALGKVENGPSYQVDVMYGYDATKTHAAGFDQAAASNVQVDIEQAFLGFTCPWTGANVTLGKFVTPFGVEVIEAKDDYNISRGFLFNYAIPFGHTGLKADTSFLDGKYTALVGVVNGWDNSQDNNKGKTFIGQFATTVLPKAKIVVGGASGPEASEKNNRNLVDAIVTVTPFSQLTLIGNLDYGIEEGSDTDGPGNDNTTDNWVGTALHANYAFNDMYSAAFRWESLSDEGARTGTDQVLHSGTLTLQAKKNGVIYRVEYRRDSSSNTSFVDSDGLANDTQKTVGAQVIYAF